MRKIILVIFLAVYVSIAGRANAALIFRQGEGWHGESEDTGPVEATASAQLQKAEEYENKGDYRHALGAYRALVKKYPSAGVASKAQFKVGEMNERLGDPSKAFDGYAAYVLKYPKGESFDRAVEAQFNIAKLFLEGERKRVFGVKTFSSMTRAQEMFQWIINNAPFSRFAPMSQFNIGVTLEKQGNLPESIAAYQALITKYPDSPAAAEAQYQIGFVYWSQSRSGSYDRMASDKAREAFEDFIARYPKSEKIPQAQENLKSLSEREIQGALGIAKFYDKQKNYKAAYIYYNQTIKQQPGSADAETAKNRIEELKNLVGEDALRAGPERTETGARASQRRKLQAQVDTAARPDYVGPPVVVPDETAPSKPKIRVSPEDLGPVPAVEPALPQQ